MTEPTIPPRPWPDGVQPEPEDVARWMKGMTYNELVAVVARMQHLVGSAERCFMDHHVGRIESLTAEATWLREQMNAPRIIHLPDDVDVEDLRRRFLEAACGPGPVTVLSEPRPRPVPYLDVPAFDVCGAPPPSDWCAGALREVYPDAAGVSQCARVTGHDDDDGHIGLIWLPDGSGRFLGQSVAFP